jgi:hypothetical protein
MSEYYLADHKASERALQQERESQDKPKTGAIKVTLLGDFHTVGEPPGCDPYNSTHGKSVPVPDVWRLRRDRR